MEFQGRLLILVALFSFVNVGQAKAVGDQICANISNIVSVMPTIVSYIDGNKIKCKLSGCKTYWKCKSMDLGDHLDFTLTMLCDALAQYGPGFFPNSAFPAINGELLNIQGSLQSMTTMLPIQNQAGFDASLLGGDFLDVENAMTNIQGLIPFPPGQEQERWVRKRKYCAVAPYASGSGNNNNNTPPEAAACTDGVADPNGDTTGLDNCTGTADAAPVDAAAQADYDSQLQAQVTTDCSSLLPDQVAYDACAANVGATFVYVPSASVNTAATGANQTAVGNTGMTQQEIDDLAAQTNDPNTAPAACIPQGMVLPPEVVIPPESYCP